MYLSIFLQENLTDVAHITTVEYDLVEELTFLTGVVQNAPATHSLEILLTCYLY
ncbi:hypothetical protein OIU78_010344 [Salix suchowensis]|nr:hypothetical protein OIU78_010344 [Salix suchowensis]